MCTVWHVDEYITTFKLVMNSRKIARGPVPGRGPAVEKHCSRRGYGFIITYLQRMYRKLKLEHRLEFYHVKHNIQMP